MMKVTMRKLLSFVLVLALTFSFSASVAGADRNAASGAYNSECVLVETLTALVENFGIRYYGTPNEKNSAIYVKEQFEKYSSFVAEMVEIPLKFPGGYLYPNSIGRPGVVELIDGPWIMGRPMPNSATFGNDALGDFSGTFHDFGTFPNVSLPDDLSGKVYGALRIDGTGTQGAVTLANINPFFAAFNEKYGDSAELTGLFISRTLNAVGEVQGVPIYNGIPAAIANIPVNTIGLTLPCLENLVIEAERSNIKDVFRFDPTVTYSAYATKPAATNEPDLVIVISAHLDGVWGAPSANDNASGVSALIELARRFDNVDLGNIELILAAVGGEEYGDFEGSSYICERLEREGKISRGTPTGSAGNWRGEPGVGVNFNMDMIAPALNAVTLGGAALSTVFASNRSMTYNLASYLIVDEAASVQAPTALSGIVTNVVSQSATGVSDHHMFQYFGFDAASLNHGLERGYHTAFDNIEDNYSYDRHLYSVDIMASAIQKAIDQETTKRARFETKIKRVDTEVSLRNASQLFHTYDEVSARFTGKDSGVIFDLTFTKDEPMFVLPGAEEFEASHVLAAGSGIANVATGQVNSFSTRLVSSVDVVERVSVDATAQVVPDRNGPLNTVTVSIIDGYSNGSSETAAVQAFSGIGNGNIGAGNYQVKVYDITYNVFVRTTGRDRVQECYIVSERVDSARIAPVALRFAPAAPAWWIDEVVEDFAERLPS